ncbi:MAG: hypothetical protein M3Q11_06970 [Pseudomonadota bacterium]|nr:hypothetical protein [Pseudomonadota bacterium]
MGHGIAAAFIQFPSAAGVTGRQHGCTACHAIPEIVGSQMFVGPPLEGIGQRAFIGGMLANTPEDMVRWLLDPAAVDPLTTMPDMAMSEKDARRIAACLRTLDRVEN